jgi:hypothetical protein
VEVVRYQIRVVLWVPMVLGVAVMLTGGGVVVYARSLAHGSRSLRRPDQPDAESIESGDRADPASGLSLDPRSTQRWGLGTLVTGAFLVVTGAFFVATH